MSAAYWKQFNDELLEMLLEQEQDDEGLDHENWEGNEEDLPYCGYKGEGCGKCSNCLE